MELKDIVCDLKYAKLLKKYGVDQTKSFAVFYGNGLLYEFDEANRDMCGMLSRRENKKVQERFTAAFTSDELLEILPKNIPNNFNDHSDYYFCMGYDSENHFPIVYYEDNDLSGSEETLVVKYDKKFSNALAKLLIWLIKNKHVILGNSEKDCPPKQKEIPTERPIYKRIPKFFYSFKNGFWVRTSKEYTQGGSQFVWRDFIKEETGEKMEDCGETTSARLRNRILSYINNPNLF